MEKHRSQVFPELFIGIINAVESGDIKRRWAAGIPLALPRFRGSIEAPTAKIPITKTTRQTALLALILLRVHLFLKRLFFKL